jgi:hypothetical protein
MGTRKYLFFCILVSISLWSCAQTKKIIKNIYATYEVHLPGNIAIDPNGKEYAPGDTVDFVYIETVSNDIQWQQAWKNNQCYSIIPTRIDSDIFNAGVNKINNRPILLHVDKGNSLWKLRLVLAEKPLTAPELVGKGKILLKGNYKGKIITDIVSNLIEINTIPSQ